MKQFLSILLPLSFLVCCTNQTKENSNQNSTSSTDVGSDTLSDKCDGVSDSLLLTYAYAFKPDNINLSKSITSDVDSFLMKIDTSCLSKKREGKVFVSLILCKLYYYHLSCCNQGYDLRSMKEGSASYLINEFERLAGYYGKKLEMLNSGMIIEYIQQDSILKKDTEIQKAYSKILTEEKRIEKGVF